MFGVTRRIIQFLLAPNTLRALLIVPLCIVVYKIAAHFELSLKSILFNHIPLLLLSLAAAFALRFSSQLRARTDRFFFHETHQQEQLVMSLLEQIPNLGELSEVIYHTCQTLNEAYQATPMHFFFRATRELKLVYSYGGATEVMQIPEEARLRNLLKREGRTIEYPFQMEQQLPPSEQAWLDQLQARLLIPVMGKDRRVLGLITLGEKRSALAYSANDYVLLNAIGGHLARRLEREEIRTQIQLQSNAPLATLARLEAERNKPAPATPAELAEEPAPNSQATTQPIEDEKSLWI